MPEFLRLRVLEPGLFLLDAPEVEWVQVLLADGGGIGIYPGHAPLLAETMTGSLLYADARGEHEVILAAGVLQVDPETVVINTSGVVDEAQTPLGGGVAVRRFERLARATSSDAS
ncbi:MAG: hypothetical protein ACYC5M_00615 [Anaerolineae bacterium]